MVSFWPWKGSDTSPASFEKSLSAIAKKIGVASAGLESSRQQSRRLKALWTLYTSIAYLLYLMIVVLVTGIDSMSMVEIGSLIGSPLVIYGVREVIARFYAYRTANRQAYLQSLQKQRDDIITKLKEATKYDSTQQLLEKYGGTPAKPKQDNSQEKSENNGQEHDPRRSKRPMLIPPPTVNIPRGPISAPIASHESGFAPSIPKPPLTAAANTPSWAQTQSPTSPIENTAEFAPNAFPPSHYYAQPGEELRSPKWYDRFLDVLLGEDESHPKNRIVLICKNCRLVNGQAPPGTKSLEEVGKWRCSSCGTMNGEESEMQKIVAKIRNTQTAKPTTDIDTNESENRDSILVESIEDDGESVRHSDDEIKNEGDTIQSGRETRSATARRGRKAED